MESAALAAFFSAILSGAVQRGTPLAYAALGEAIAERSGVMNLGVEGMMLVGAASAFAVQVNTQSPVLAVMAGAACAAALAAVHGLLVLVFNANQIVSGFALTILGSGVSGFYGRPYVGVQIAGVEAIPVPLLHRLPFFGSTFFNHDALVYLSLPAALAAWFLLYRTSLGLDIRASGESPDAAYAHGVKVRRSRLIAIVIGGLFSGVGGAHLSIAYTQVWSEGMTAGQGWIALGLVIVARWRPVPLLLLAWSFGALLVLHPHLQAAGYEVSSYLIAMIPYVITIMALTGITVFYHRAGRSMPATLAKRLELPDQ